MSERPGPEAEGSRATAGVVPVAVGLDVGGTKIAAMRVDATGVIQERAQVPTPDASVDELLETLGKLARTVMSADVRGVGVGMTGMVDFEPGVVRYGPNLPFRDVPVRQFVEEVTGLPCLVDNDANVAAWAEYRLGAGRGHTDMLCVTVGTGIGGGIVAGGRMLRGAHGFGAEIGHFIVEPDGPECGCGNRGCWEQVASGRAIQRLGRASVEAGTPSLLSELAGGDWTRVTGPIVTEAAMKGDPTSVGILAEVGKRLGEGIAGLINVLDPEVVVVGGGAIAAGELLLGPAREVAARTILGPRFRPEVPVVAAIMGNEAGGVGAALLALHELDP